MHLSGARSFTKCRSQISNMSEPHSFSSHADVKTFSRISSETGHSNEYICDFENN